jgi:uncharacterized membrane protein
LRPDQVARTFQTIRLFGKLSLLDRVKIAQQLDGTAGFAETLMSGRAFFRKEHGPEGRQLFGGPFSGMLWPPVRVGRSRLLSRTPQSRFGRALMPSWIHPYREPQEIHELVDRLRDGPAHLVNPQQVLQEFRNERSTFGRFNGWLADHIVGLAGTMVFFYFLSLLMFGWAYWQGVVQGNHGFDPYPYSFLFFILGGVMQSLFVPTMLTASNRATARDRVKDDTDHRAWTHLYEVNDEQLQILKQLQSAQVAHLPQG